MGQLLQLNKAPRVFTPGFCHQLAIANSAVRQLRDMGVALMSCDVREDGARIVVNRNPHQTLADCPGVRVTHNFERKSK